MSRISEEAFRWALERLRSWSNASTPGRRDKQTLYRLLLLRELGVEKNSWQVLNTANFREHCRRWLLVSPASLSEKTGGEERYFVPLSFEYQFANSSSDWAIGTMWTRFDTWQRQGIIEYEKEEKNKRKVRFTPNYVDIFLEKMEGNPIPALALATFLYRDKEIDIQPSFSEKDSEKLVQLFLEEFNLTSDGLERIFDRDVRT